MSRSANVVAWRGWAGLVALSALNFGLSYVPSLGDGRLPIALVLAGASAALLLLVFMELRHAPLSMKLALLAAAGLLALLIGLMLGDVVFRESPLAPPGAPAPGIADLPSHAD